MIDGKAVYVGLVMGASGLIVAGEGVPSGTYKFLFTDQGMVVQSTKAGQTATVLVRGNQVAPAPMDLSRAFGSGAVSTFAEVSNERMEAARNADEQRQSRSRIAIGQNNESSAQIDLNSLSIWLDLSFIFAEWSNTSDVLVPDSWTSVVTQNDSNLTTIVNNASDAPNP